jgi:hypothetical protein
MRCASSEAVAGPRARRIVAVTVSDYRGHSGSGAVCGSRIAREFFAAAPHRATEASDSPLPPPPRPRLATAQQALASPRPSGAAGALTSYGRSGVSLPPI